MENYILANGKKFFIHPVYTKYAANEDGEIINIRLRNIRKGNLGNSGYLRADDCKYRESLARLKKSKILIICQKNPFGKLSSKKIFLTFKNL